MASLVFDHDDVPQSTRLSSSTSDLSTIGCTCGSSGKLEEATAEIFRLRSKVSFFERRDAEFQQMLREKNENEDRLRGLVNELQLSLELAKISHSSTFAAEEENFFSSQPQHQQHQPPVSSATPPTQPATPMMSSAGAPPSIGVSSGCAPTAGHNATSTPPPEGLCLGSSSFTPRQALAGREESASTSQSTPPPPHRQFKVVSKASKEVAAKTQLPNEGVFGASSPQRRWAVVVPGPSPAKAAGDTEVEATSPRFTLPDSQGDEEAETLEEVLHAGFKRMRLED